MSEDPAANPALATSGAAASNDACSSFGGGAASKQSAQESEEEEEEEAEELKWDTAKTIKQYWSTRKTFFTEKQRADAWEETATIVKDYSDELIARWNKEIQNLPIFAGLFAAIQASFNVEVYKLLTPDTDPDPVLVALERISAQLSGFSVNAAFVNSTQPSFVLGAATPTPAVALWIVVLNALWFSSLILSLAAAAIGMLVNQWLNEYTFGVSGTTRQTARLRQLRLNSLQRWRVQEIVSFLPVLLQIASGLFFAGLLILLWNLNRTVAIVGTVLVGILAVFSLSTIILPSIATHCCYLSPPSRVVFELIRPFRKALYQCRRQLITWLLYHYQCPIINDLESLNWLYLYSREAWDMHPRIYRLCKMLFPRDAASTLSWRGMESALISRRADELDGEMVATAYTTLMDTDFLDRAVMCTTELSLISMSTCIQKIISANIAHWGKDGHWGPMWSVRPCTWSGALIALMHLSGNNTVLPLTLVAALKTAHKYVTGGGVLIPADAPGTRLHCVDLSRLIWHYGMTLPPHSLDWELVSILNRTRDMNLGNDVRQHVISTRIGDALKGLEGTIIEDPSIQRALYALLIIIYCVPSRTGSDYKCDDPEYKAMQSQAARALKAFSNFLYTSPSLAVEEEYGSLINHVFDALHMHGEREGLMSPELCQAIVRYRDAYQSAHEQLPWYGHDNEVWIQTLRREMDASGQCVLLTYTNEALAGLDRAQDTTENSDIGRALIALRCVIFYVSPNPGLDWKCDHMEYKAMQAQAVLALHAFSNFLSTFTRWEEHGTTILYVLNALRAYGEAAGLMSVEVRQAIVCNRDAYQSAYGGIVDESDTMERRLRDWIQKLTLQLEDSGQNTGADDVVSIFAERRVEHSLDVDTATTAGNGILVNVAASPQRAFDEHGACAEPEPDLDQSCCSPSTPPPSSDHTALADTSKICIPGAPQGERSVRSQTELTAGSGSSSSSSSTSPPSRGAYGLP